jgi:hypothetical protein
MSADPSVSPADIEIPLDATKLKGILERDKDPRFVTLQVAREGVSKNRRNYSAEVIDSIAEQINSQQPIGGPGHIPDDQRAYVFPPTETVWLGAVVKEIDGKKVCYAKGYVLPDAKNRRNYLQMCKDLGKNVAVSIYGKAKEAVYNAAEKAYDIRGLALERIDWTPPGAEGIPNDGTLILTSEMVDSKGKHKESPMDKEKVIKEATLSEMQQFNPKLVEEIQGGVTAVSEMADLRKALGIDAKAKPAETIAEMQQTIRQHELTDELRDRVKVPQARPIIKQMVLGEMKADEAVVDTIERVLKTEDAKAIISSKSGAPNLSPANDGRGSKTVRKFTKA